MTGQQSPADDAAKRETTSREGDDAQERKRKLEEELDRYAQAGVASPGLLKSAKWVSRGLYMAMAAVVVFLLFSGWGKHSQQTVDELQQSRDAWKKSAEGLKAERKTLEEKLSDLVIAAAKAETARRDAEAAIQGPAAADAAMRAAHALVQRAWGEQAYARHWRELLARAEPEAHGDPKSGAIAMLEQAETAPARQRIELLRELADFGTVGVGAAARGLVVSDRDSVKPVAALTVARLGAQEDAALLDKVARETTEPQVVRELYFAASLLWLESGRTDTPAAVDWPEYWLRFAMRGYEARQEELAARYREAPESARLELLALLGECGGPEQEELMRTVASSTRPGAERILAVRWLGSRKLAGELLKTLAQGEGPVAAAAKAATGG